MLLARLRFWIQSRGRMNQPMPCDVKTARLLLARGANHDLTVAAALGDFDRVKAILNEDPSQIREARPNGRRPLTTAVEFGHESIARFLQQPTRKSIAGRTEPLSKPERPKPPSLLMLPV